MPIAHWRDGRARLRFARADRRVQNLEHSRQGRLLSRAIFAPSKKNNPFDDNNPMMVISLQPRNCSICGASDAAGLFAEANVGLEALDRFAFASRKLPEYMHWRLWECRRCDLLVRRSGARPRRVSRLVPASRLRQSPGSCDMRAALTPDFCRGVHVSACPIETGLWISAQETDLFFENCLLPVSITLPASSPRSHRSRRPSPGSDP